MQSNTGLLAPEFSDCIDALHHYRVSFVLVGGYAVGFHGVVRATGDIDFLYEQTEQNVNALCVALRRFGKSLLVIGLNELRRNKAATGRAKDKQDLQRLQQLSAGNAKVPRIRRKPERG